MKAEKRALESQNRTLIAERDQARNMLNDLTSKVIADYPTHQ